MLVILLTGGICAGKSTVAAKFNEKNVPIIDMDKIGHQLLTTLEVNKKIVAAFGCEVLDENGAISRKRLASVVFAEKTRIDTLSGIMTPVVVAELQRQIEENRQKGRRTVVLDAPLALENGVDKLITINLSVFIHADLEIRKQRAITNRGWPSDEIEKREKFQLSVEDKKTRSDFILDNDNKESLDRDFEKLWSMINSQSFRSNDEF